MGGPLAPDELGLALMAYENRGRPMGVKPQAPPPRKRHKVQPKVWFCVHCDAKNEVDRDRCHECGIMRPSTDRWWEDK